MTRNTHTVIYKVGGEYVRKIVPADPESNLLDTLAEALQHKTLISNDDDVLVLADDTLKEYYEQRKL